MSDVKTIETWKMDDFLQKLEKVVGIELYGPAISQSDCMKTGPYQLPIINRNTNLYFLVTTDTVNSLLYGIIITLLHIGCHIDNPRQITDIKISKDKVYLTWLFICLQKKLQHHL